MSQSQFRHMRPIHIFLAVVAGLLLAVTLRAAPFYVSGAPLPTSVGSPTSDQGVALSTRSFNVTNLVLHNTGAVDYTVKVYDCQSSPFYLFGSASTSTTIAAGSTWTLSWSAPGLRFQGCFRWVASNAAVVGAVSGQ